MLDTIRRAMVAGLPTLLLIAAPAAALTDRSFESGFGAWNAFGDALIDGSTTYGSAPTDGALQVLLSTLPNNAFDDQGAPLGGAGPFSGTDAISAAALESSLGLTAGVLDGLSPSGNAAFQGSGLFQDFSITAPSTLSFDWNFLSNETVPTANYTDFLFWALVPSGGGAVIASGSLADTNGSTFVASSAADFAFETGYQSSFSVDITSAGSYRFVVGVVDVLDDNYTSGVLLDNFALVPEPSTALLLAVGLLGLTRRPRPS